MANYIAPSVETIDKYDLWPFVRRALGLIRDVREIDANTWEVHHYIVRWDGAGFLCECWNWETYHQRQGGFCKHSLAVSLRSTSYRERILTAMDEKEVEDVTV